MADRKLVDDLLDIYRSHRELLRDATHGKDDRLSDGILEKYDRILVALGVKGNK